MPLWLALLLGLMPSAALADCEATSTELRAEGRTVTVMFATLPARIKVGELFSLDVTLCPSPAAGAIRGFKVDAGMPEHRHGMNYQPKVLRVGEYRYAANGLMFHMPGRWRFVFDIDTAAGRERILSDYLLD